MACMRVQVCLYLLFLVQNLADGCLLYTPEYARSLGDVEAVRRHTRFLEGLYQSSFKLASFLSSLPFGFDSAWLLATAQ